MKYTFLFMVLFFMAACSPMDDNYKQFIEDGPITYIARLDETQVQVIGERERINFVWPKQHDPRGKKAIIYWSSRAGKYEVDVNPAEETSIYVAPLDEGSYIFEVFIVDDQGNFSTPASLSGNVYGSIYESYLINRNITGNTQSGTNRKITYTKVVDETMIGTDFEWIQDGSATPLTASIDASELTGTLNNFKASSFRYRTRYIPEGGVDIFYAPWQYYVENAKPENISFDFSSKKITFPVPNDGNWVSYEMQWTDKTTGVAHSQTVTSGEVVIPSYNGREFTYYSVFNIDGQPVMTTSNTVKTAIYTDLERTSWYAAPETALDGTPLASVNYGTAPPTATATSGITITNKIKSPYLSHLLPYNSAALANDTGDGANNPSAHFDNNSRTYLSMVKGIGTDATSGAGHFNGGVNYIGVGEKPWFIVRLDENTPQKFNYFRIRYRENGSNGAGLKPQGVTLFGSNDDDCITDDSKWTQINSDIIVPPGSTANSTQPAAADMGTFAPGANLESGNVVLPKTCEYRYVKVRYDKWDVNSNTIQIAEFYLGFVD